MLGPTLTLKLNDCCVLLTQYAYLYDFDLVISPLFVFKEIKLTVVLLLVVVTSV